MHTNGWTRWQRIAQACKPNRNCLAKSGDEKKRERKKKRSEKRRKAEENCRTLDRELAVHTRSRSKLKVIRGTHSQTITKRHTERESNTQKNLKPEKRIYTNFSHIIHTFALFFRSFSHSFRLHGIRFGTLCFRVGFPFFGSLSVSVCVHFGYLAVCTRIVFSKRWSR